MINNLEEMPQALNYLISKVESLEEMVNELSVQKDVHEQPEWMNIDDLRQYLPSHPAKQLKEVDVQEVGNRRMVTPRT